MLILKRNPDAHYTESYNVLFEGRYVGRIYKAVSAAPREAPWFWVLNFTSGRAVMGRNTATSQLWKSQTRHSAPHGIEGQHIKNETGEHWHRLAVSHF